MQASIRITLNGFEVEIKYDEDFDLAEAEQHIRTLETITGRFDDMGIKPSGHSKSGSSSRKGGKLVDDNEATLLRIFPPWLNGREEFVEFENALTGALSGTGVAFSKVASSEAKKAGFISQHYIVPFSVAANVRKSDYFSTYENADILKVKSVKASGDAFFKLCAAALRRDYDGMVFSAEDYQSNAFRALLTPKIRKDGSITLENVKKVLDDYAKQA